MLFFDLPSDRYFMLSGSRAKCFERFTAGQASAQDIQELQTEGLISPAPGPPCSKDPPAPPAKQSLVDGPLPRGAIRATIASVRAQISARHDLRRHDLPHVIAGFHSECPAEASADPDICAGLAAAFMRAARYLPATDQCLARGIAMKRLLFARGCRSTLVFGVTMPFAAHCWVQVGETVLTDPLDVILHYQPIFAI
ncbi:MAG TPA: lasso peptide biosynthesis B2 protein [Afipia sp.]